MRLCASNGGTSEREGDKALNVHNRIYLELTPLNASMQIADADQMRSIRCSRVGRIPISAIRMHEPTTPKNNNGFYSFNN